MGHECDVAGDGQLLLDGLERGGQGGVTGQVGRDFIGDRVTAQGTEGRADV